MSTSQGLGRRRPPLCALVPWPHVFEVGALGEQAGRAMARELYFGGYPPPAVQIPLNWLAGPVRIRQANKLNRAEVSQSGGATARSSNIADPNERQWVFSATLDSIVDVDAANLAKWVTDYYDSPLPRSAALTLILNSRTETEIWRILGVKQGQHISITDAPGSTTTVASDTFSRVESNGWGVEPLSGQTWTVTPVAADFSATGTVARIATATVAQLYLSTVDTGGTDHAVTVTETLPVLPTGAGFTLRAIGRHTDASNFYNASVTIATSGAATLSLTKNVGGSGSVVDAGTGVGTHAAGNAWTLVFEVVGSTLQARAWNATTSTDPGTWQVIATDGSLTTGSRAGCGVRRESGNLDGTVNVDFDNATVTVPNPHAWPTGAAELLVEGITHQVTADERRVTWNTSPVIGATAGTSGPWARYDETRYSSATDLSPF